MPGSWRFQAEASSLQGYSLDEDFEEMGDAGWPEAAVGDGFSDDKVEVRPGEGIQTTVIYR